jgi:membrane-associated phospholipid phosphatase
VHRLWVLVTDCGDSAVTLPLALLVLIFLLTARERLLALHWLLMVAGCAAVIGVLKLIFGACGGHLEALEVISPSGHTAMSTAIYGSLALLVAASLSARWRPLVLAAATLLIAAIAISRVVLRFHDLPEVALGLVVGIAAVAGFRALMRRGAAPVLPVVWLMLGGLVVVAVMHGTRLNIEPGVRGLAGALRLTLPWCR